MDEYIKRSWVDGEFQPGFTKGIDFMGPTHPLSPPFSPSSLPKPFGHCRLRWPLVLN
jgi:hypothetical protein